MPQRTRTRRKRRPMPSAGWRSTNRLRCLRVRISGHTINSKPQSHLPSPRLSPRLRVSASNRLPRPLLEIQALLPDLVDLAFGAQGQVRDGQTQIAQAACLREYRIRLAIHLLQQEIQALADFALAGQQLDAQFGLPEDHHARDWAVGMKFVVD